MNKASYFKLPLIFITPYFLIKIGFLIIIHLSIKPSEYTAILFLGSSLQMVFPLSLYFITTIFLCNKYHLYTTTTKDMPIFILTAIIFPVLSIGWGFLNSYAMRFVYNDIIEEGQYGYLKYFNVFNSILSDIIHVIILILLFKFLLAPTAQQRQPYLLDEISGKKIYAAIYSLLVLMCSLFYISFSAFPAILALSFSFNLDIGSISLIIIPILILSPIIHYLFVYASTYNCFQRFDSRLKAVPLLKSLGLTLLFIFIGSLILGLILGLIMAVYLSSHGYYSISPVFIDRLITTGIILSIVILFISTRLGVKCIFGAKKSSAPEISNIVETE